MTRKAIPIGFKNGRLTVIGMGIREGRFFKCLCRCECGREKMILENSIRDSSTKSCGCLWRENVFGKYNPAIPDGGAARNTLYRNYQARALRDGLDFSLTSHEFHELTVQSCHYCGREPSQRINSKYAGGAFIYNGIDRKENQVGYVKGNCVACCKRCNTMKGNLSYMEFVAYLTKMYEYWLKPFIGIVVCSVDAVAGRR